jgi:uncharacterized spore protein YtfJ
MIIIMIRRQLSAKPPEEKIMEHVEKIFKNAIEEVERMLSARTVVGEPITIDGNTIIPLVSFGFGFGTGGGQGKCPMKSDKGEGYGGGTGAGAGIKPIAVIIINQDGVRVESIKGPAGSLVEKVAETIGRVASRRREEASES